MRRLENIGAFTVACALVLLILGPAARDVLTLIKDGGMILRTIREARD